MKYIPSARKVRSSGYWSVINEERFLCSKLLAPVAGTAGQRPTAPTGGCFSPTRGRSLASLRESSHVR